MKNPYLVKTGNHRLSIEPDGTCYCYLCERAGTIEDLCECPAPQAEREDFDSRYTPAEEKPTLKLELPETLRDLYSSRGFDLYIGSTQGSDFFINDPDRAARCHDAAEHGADGSTHAEHINDWREYLKLLFNEAMAEAWRLDDETAYAAAENSLANWEAKITAEIDACESWHEANGSLHEEIG